MALGKNISPGQGETYYRMDDYYLEREGGEDHSPRFSRNKNKVGGDSR